MVSLSETFSCYCQSLQARNQILDEALRWPREGPWTRSPPSSSCITAILCAGLFNDKGIKLTKTVHDALTSQQHYSCYLKYRSNTNGRHQMTGSARCGLYLQWSMTQILKGRGSWHMLQYGWTLRALCWVKSASHKRTNTAWFHLKRGTQSSQIQRQKIDWYCQGLWKSGRWGVIISWVQSLFHRWKSSRDGWWWWFHTVNLLKVTELGST